MSDHEEADDLARRVSGPTRNGGRHYVKDESKIRHGTKTAQLGLRISEDELKLAMQVCAHRNVSFTNWVTFVILRSVERGMNVLELQLWEPPSPAPHDKNVRVATRVRDPFLAKVPGIPFAKAVRWALKAEAPRALAEPSALERMRRAAEKRAEFLRAPAVKQIVHVPISNTWEGEGS